MEKNNEQDGVTMLIKFNKINSIVLIKATDYILIFPLLLMLWFKVGIVWVHWILKIQNVPKSYLANELINHLKWP